MFKPFFTKLMSQLPGGIDFMDPFYSHASRFVIWDGGNDDNNSEGPKNPTYRAIVVEEPRSGRYIEFSVRADAISSVSPYFKTIFDIYPTKKRLGISGTADEMQILLKYMHTGIYNPTDISHRHRNKHDIVFRYIDFYLFCQRLGYKSLLDMVCAGIQATLDLMTWSPLPATADTVLLHPREGSSEEPSFVPILMSLFSACELYYPKIKQDDPIQKCLLIYSYHLWQKLNSGASAFPETQYTSKFWNDLKKYHKKTGSVDIYNKEAPKYNISTLSPWDSDLVTFGCVVIIAACLIRFLL